MQRLPLLALLLAILALTAPRSEAQFVFTPYGGFDFEYDAALIGVGAEFATPALGVPFALAVRPAVEYYFLGAGVDQFSRTLVGLNADVVAQITPAAPAGFFAGAGLGVTFLSSDAPGSSSSSDFGLNLIGGAQFGTGFASPFAQGRVTLGDGTRFAALGGIRLNL